MLPEDLFAQLEDEPLDLLDKQKTRSALRSSEYPERKEAGSDDEPEIDSGGRLVIHEEGGKPKKARRRSGPDDSDAARSEEAGSIIMSGGKSSSRKIIQKKRRKTCESGGWAYTGSEYTSKKAHGGDVMRKGKLEPYAYWPLDRKMMSRRPEHRAAARKGMVKLITKKLVGKSASSSALLPLKKPMKPKKKGSRRKTGR